MITHDEVDYPMFTHWQDSNDAPGMKYFFKMIS